MKKLIVIFVFTFISSISYGQIISASKDTLTYLSANNPHPYDIYDSLYIYNSSDLSLKIDSIFNKNNFHYNLIYKYNGEIEKSDRIENSSIYPIAIAPNDSGKFIFEFIVPVTKRSNNFELWSDSLFIYNNSINSPILTLSVINDIPLSVDEIIEIPNEFALYQNYPNPFNPFTKIKFKLNKSSHIKLIVTNILGEEISTLVDSYKQIGTHELEFNSFNLSSGIYFYHLMINGNTITKKMIVLN